MFSSPSCLHDQERRRAVPEVPAGEAGRQDSCLHGKPLPQENRDPTTPLRRLRPQTRARFPPTRSLQTQFSGPPRPAQCQADTSGKNLSPSYFKDSQILPGSQSTRNIDAK